MARRRDDSGRVEIGGRAALRDWLEANHQREESVWLVLWRGHVAERHVPWSEVVDEALAFGWIDSLPRKLDADRTMLRLSPRRPGSAWSAINKEKVERLRASGLMRPPGEAAVARAVADGSWRALEAVETLALPPDLAAALDAAPGARAAFGGFPPSSRRGILEWIALAKRPETRAKRIATTVSEATAGRRANHPRR